MLTYAIVALVSAVAGGIVHKVYSAKANKVVADVKSAVAEVKKDA